MRFLAIDTSSAVSVAVLDGDDVVAAASAYEPRRHAEALAPMIRDVLDRGGAGDVDSIVVGTGPAPFTGLRVGLVTARTLGLAWEVPVLGVCSLDALGAAPSGDVTVIADARRREVYWARYRDGARVAGPGVDVPSAVEVVGEVVGRGATLFPDVFGASPDPSRWDPDPAWLARVATRTPGAAVVPPEPLYLRRPDVHRAPSP